MKCRSSLWVAFALLMFALPSHARVFEFGHEGFASYFGGTYSHVGTSQNAFGYASGSNTSFNNEVNYAYSGEVGFLVSPDKNFTLRLGLELMQAHPMSQIAGNNKTSGQKDLDLTSTIFVLNPIATAEFSFYKTAATRAFVFGGLGYSMVTLVNKYSLTTTGQTDLGVADDYDEKAQGNFLDYTGGIGFETLFVDNITVMFDVGYRYLNMDRFTFKNNPITIAQGQVQKGDVLKNSDGGRRRFNFNSVFAGIAFRFYVNLF